MSEPTRLLLIRHCEPDEQAQGRCYGSLDVELSTAGRQNAGQLAAALDRMTLAAIYTSPARRAIETAGPLARRRRLEPIIEEALREIDFGDFEGRTYDEIAHSHPEHYQRWMQSPTRMRFPGGESYPQLKQRALMAMDAIRTRHPSERTAVVTHGGVIRAMLAHCLSMPDEAIFRLDQGYGSLNIIDWIDSAPVVRLFNVRVGDPQRSFVEPPSHQGTPV